MMMNRGSHSAKVYALLALALPFAARATAAADAGVALRPLHTHHAGVFAQSAAEIPAFCPDSRRVFVVNAQAGRVDVFTLEQTGALAPSGMIHAARDLPGAMGAVNSVSVYHGILAVAVEADPPTDPGIVAFYDTTTFTMTGFVAAGALPDMVTFSPNGRWVLVANEGEPNNDYTVDPEGTITIVDLQAGFSRLAARTVTFRDWNADGRRAAELPSLMERGLRHFGRVTVQRMPLATRAASFSEDVEPEWIECDPAGRLAYVCLQEANAIAEVDIAKAAVTRIIPLGFKDHAASGNEVDVSDKDGGIHIRARAGLYGVYQPDTIRFLSKDGRRYIMTANEGDSRVRPASDGAVAGLREGSIFNDESTLRDWKTAGTPLEDAATDRDLGRVKLVRDLVARHLDDEGRPTKLFSFGARSFSIFDIESGLRVFDSGGDFERIIAKQIPEHFNTSNDSIDFEKRSRSKGPEPEGLAVGDVGDRKFAFIGLERAGGIMVYDVTEPERTQHVGYFNNRRHDVPITLSDGTPNPQAGDSGPEGLVFVGAERSPTGTPLLIVSNETSGTTTVWEVTSP